MISGGIAFVVGAALQAGAVNMGMLIIGRLFLGLGIGFANQVSQESADSPADCLSTLSQGP